MKRIGVVGVGRMGGPIASRLSAAGFDVSVFDVRADAVDAIRDEGIRVADDVRDLASAVELVVTVLPGPTELRSVMEGRDGVLATMTSGSCWLDLTSCDPTTAGELGADAGARGIDVVGAPMGGSPADASSGSLTFFVGGASAAIERVRAMLVELGGASGITVVGTAIGDGYLAKLLANTLWFGQVIAVTEVLLLGEAHGLEPARFKAVLEQSAGGSAFITRHLDRLLVGDYLPTFGIDRVVEELEAVRRLADEAGSPTRLTNLVADLHAEALEVFGPVDGELLAAKLLEQRAGRSLRSAPRR